jgi:DNA-binding transcriptional LysR family regulator
MLDRVTSMQVFVRVATLGSFSAAARSLGLSQTMVTKHVAALEDRLGVKLLHRSTRRLVLTEGGRDYLAACERILSEIEEAEASASLDRVEPRGTLRLNVPLTFGFRQIAPALAEFSRLHPAVSVELGLADRYVDLIEEGWDLAIRIGRLKDSSLVRPAVGPMPHRRLRRPIVSRQAWSAAELGRSRPPQLPRIHFAERHRGRPVVLRRRWRCGRPGSGKPAGE